jgi:hypothetical protein
VTCYIARLGVEDLPWAFSATWDFSAEMVQAVKTHIPSRRRAWQPDRKRWVFRADQLDTVCNLADIYTDGWCEVEPEREAAPQLPVSVPAAYAVLRLAPTAPPELVQVAYKFWAKRVHPDHGGDVCEMQRINAAYSILSCSKGQA